MRKVFLLLGNQGEGRSLKKKKGVIKLGMGKMAIKEENNNI